jgi:hypothetical protein
MQQAQVKAPQVSVHRPDPGALPTETSPVDLIRNQFRYGQNATIGVRSGADNSFAVLRQMANYGHIRTCIEARKDQISSLKLEFRRKDKLKSDISEERIAKVRAFFDKPDKKRTWDVWLRLMLEEVLTIDALSIYRRKTFGGELHALEIIDGTTILPMIDERGDIPEAPNVAYRQVIYGKPIVGGDCTIDDLMYRPRVVRTNTLYGMSPIEWVLMAINAALNRDTYNLAWYTEGNMPDGVMDAPSSWNPDQIIEFEALLNRKFAGVLNIGERRKLKVLSQGMAASYKALKEPDFSGKYDEWLLKVICAAYAIPPSELGFTQDAGSKNTAKQQENVVYRRGVKPLSGFVCGILNEVIAYDLNEPGIECVLTGGEPEDKLAQAQVDAIYLDRCVISPDEVAERDGRPGVGVGRYFMLGGSPVFAEDLIDPIDTESERAGDDPALTEGARQSTAEETGAKPSDASGDEEGDALNAEMRKYRDNAIKRAKAGKAPKYFTSTIIPEAVTKDIHRALSQTRGDVSSVVQTFNQIGQVVKASRTIAKSKADIEKRIRAYFVDYFERQGKALASHLTD